MNTLLLPTNTANCTTKNLKRMAAVMLMTAVFVFGNIAVFAQGFSNSTGKTENSQSTTEEQRAVKEAWVKEHQEELNKTNATVVPKQVVTSQSAETINNAVEVKTSAPATNLNTGEANQTQTMAKQRTTRSSSVGVRNEVKPYDKSTVLNEVNKPVTYPQIPGFVATGNADADAKAFEMAKQNLQQSNPTEYNNYFSEKK